VEQDRRRARGFEAGGAQEACGGWRKTTGTGSSDLLSGVQVGSYKGDELRSANVARADSTDCTDCRTVAVAVQAVVVKGSPHTSAPTNAAIAVNENCLNCTTHAFAYQYVVSTADRVVLTRRGRRRVATLREQIDNAAHSDLAPDDLNLRLRDLAHDFREAIDGDLARQDADIEDSEVDRDSDLEQPPA
jgi:hypothetical protein